jgi:hypothetical protein
MKIVHFQVGFHLLYIPGKFFSAKSRSKTVKLVNLHLRYLLRICGDDQGSRLTLAYVNVT